MGMILPFVRTHKKRTRARTQYPLNKSSVVIFSGVRYERLDETENKEIFNQNI